MNKPQLLIPSFNIKKTDKLYEYSDPIEAQRRATLIFGDDGQLYKSVNPKKKYMILDPVNVKWVYFGQMDPPMYDFLAHKNLKRRERYLKRATKIKGKWRDNPFSPNNLSINILW
jgi:hypothetical protein